MIHTAENLGADLVREIRFGSKLLARRERFLNQQAAKKARAEKQDVRFKRQAVGQHFASVPAEEFFAFATHPKTKGCWDDEEFTRDYFKRNPHLVSNS